MSDLDFELMKALAHEPSATEATPWVVVDRKQFQFLVGEVERCWRLVEDTEALLSEYEANDRRIDALEATVPALRARLEAAEAVCEALEPDELAAIHNLVNGTSLPMDMQPARGRWLRKIETMARRLDAWRAVAPLHPQEPSDE